MKNRIKPIVPAIIGVLCFLSAPTHAQPAIQTPSDTHMSSLNTPVQKGGPTPAETFFSFGTVPVFDATAIANLVKTYTQLKTEYKKIKAKYDLAMKMARYISNMEHRYRIQFSTLKRIHTIDSFFKNTDSWIAGMNGEFTTGNALLTQVKQAYADTAEELKRLDPEYIALLPTDTRHRLKIDMASLELRDTSNVRALAAIAESTALSTGIEQKIDNLLNDSLSSAEDLNSHIAILNKVNAAMMLSLQVQRENTGLLMRMLEQSAIESKTRRDSRAHRIIHDQTVRLSIREAILDSCGGVDDTLRHFSF